MFRWYVMHSAQVFCVSQKSMLITKADDVIEFLLHTDLFRYQGVLMVSPQKRAFLYHLDDGISADFFKLSTLELRPFKIDIRDFEVVTFGSYETALLTRLNDAGTFEQAQTFHIHGPVSAFGFYVDNAEILLLGDNHDALEIPGVLSEEDILSTWGPLFALAQTVQPTKKESDLLKQNIRNMQRRLFESSQPAQTFMIWEYIVVTMYARQAQQRCVDLFVEDDLGSRELPKAPRSFLRAMRCIFGMCPLIDSHANSTQVARAQKCDAIFPNLRYHRVDFRLRKNGMKQHSDITNGNSHEKVVDTIAQCVEFSASTKLMVEFARVLTKNHDVHSKKDIRVLCTNLTRARKSFNKSVFCSNKKRFFEVFLEALQTHYKPPNHDFMIESSWFLLQSAIVDLYSICRLCVVKWHASENHHRRQPAHMCADKERVQTAIVYMGDTHIQMMREILTKCLAARMWLEQDHFCNGAILDNKTISFDATLSFFHKTH